MARATHSTATTAKLKQTATRAHEVVGEISSILDRINESKSVNAKVAMLPKLFHLVSLLKEMKITW